VSNEDGNEIAAEKACWLIIAVFSVSGELKYSAASYGK